MGGSLNKLPCSSIIPCNGCTEGKVSAETERRITAFLDDDYRHRVYTSVPHLSKLLALIPTDVDILQVYYENGFNLLQKCVAENNVEAVRLILSRDHDINNSPCSHPLHIACRNGYSECIQDLIEHGARLDIEARMCWPGPHSKRCLGVKNESKQYRKETSPYERMLVKQEGREKCQNVFFYALEGGQYIVLDYLLGIQKRGLQGTVDLGPLLEAAIEKKVWSCCNVLLEHKPDAIDSADLRNFAYPRPNNADMTVFHVLFFMVRRPADFTLRTCKELLASCLKSDVNTTDSAGSTALESLIIRYAFEESRKEWLLDYEPWGQAQTKEMIVLLLQNGGTESLNQDGNNTVSLMIRHIRDWRFVYDLLETVLESGVSPVVRDSDGNCPLMVCIIRLVNDDLFQKFDSKSKHFFLHCIRVLCMAGATPNCIYQSALTPLHVLVFTASENFQSETNEEMNENFDFIRNILILLFQFGMDANALTNKSSPSVFTGILKLVNRSTWPIDLEKVYELVLTLIQYGANPNVEMKFLDLDTYFYGKDNEFFYVECHHLLGYMFLALAQKPELLHDPQDTATRLLYLLYFSMDHNDLYKCLDSVYIPAMIPGGPCQILSDTVRDMFSKPRTLKQMARVVINRSLGRKPGMHADKLPLPKDMKDYLKNFEP